MAEQVYRSSLILAVLGVVLLPVLWAALRELLQKKRGGAWKNLNGLLFGAVVGVILSMTVLLRLPSTRKLDLLPLKFLFFPTQTKEPFRTFLMNVLLFVPFGLTLSTVLPERCGKVVGITVLVGFAFSLCVELLQFCFHLGRVELDDLIANTLGTFLGAVHLRLTRWVGPILRKWKLLREEDDEA